MYEIPSDPTIERAVVTKDCVDGIGQPILTSNPNKINYAVKLNSGKGEEKASHDASSPASAS